VTDHGHRRAQRAGKASLGMIIVAAMAVIAVAAVIAVVRVAGPHSGPQASPTHPVRYVGVYEAKSPQTYSQVNEFAKAIGRKPNLVGYYSGWDEPFQSGFAETAAQHGAATIVQMDPTGIPLAKVASGAYDSYLSKFATAVAAFGHPVVISFGREMNGFWYTWGYHHTPPAVFVAAWRHVVTLFRQHGATNVKWLWQVNSKSPQTGPVRDWWPGAQYVNWVGVSGYYVVPTDTFSYLFNPVVADVRQFTHDPVLIAETGVRPSSGQQRGIRDLFSGLRSQGYLGLAWFDEDTPGGPYKGGHWRIDSDPPALRMFRDGLAGRN
jgi:mannan endo-1,4-beta-mannosidase